MREWLAEHQWLVVLGSVGVCFVLVMSFVRYLEHRVNKVDDDQKRQDDRISSLEVKDFNQDARLDVHRKHLIQVKKDVRELGHDVGWNDNGRTTQVMDTQVMTHLVDKTKPGGDEPPPNAA